jgi:hypothetical protein
LLVISVRSSTLLVSNPLEELTIRSGLYAAKSDPAERIKPIDLP